MAVFSVSDVIVDATDSAGSRRETVHSKIDATYAVYPPPGGSWRSMPTG